ncbi:hypothetical protein [Pseudoxanthomonas indica]|uniref:DUF2938 domain-containing protein n=1 Tax=Pseudoxanthomonas indica TaxID=428993 RepID=A0A1T5JNA1_9GAMM|nr:hypothetical protein [Pseudoxanthomonas indica]GGD43336.1 hypothetical protein GCM10007235_14120 [Pseudoxanthomonas indica]SKC52855.1 hypothetical protein SAMN06296058_0951 [Pseudoxanthomonas indica]
MGRTAALNDRTWLGWLLLGGIVVASFDLLFATTFWHLSNEVPAQRILQAIAAGVYGKASFDGGARTAWVGASLHYFIAIVMVLVYGWAARRWTRLIEQPWFFGLLYGGALYVAMTFVVVPLSRTNTLQFHPLWIGASIAVHLLIGLLCAGFARKAVHSISARHPAP